MRALLPHREDGVDLRAAYAPPPDRPWVRANMVASLDGAVSLDGRSGGLSGPADKRVFGVLRSLADVVLVGAGTVRAEGYGPSEHAPIAVVSGRLALNPEAPLFTQARHRTIVVTSEAAAREHEQRGGYLAQLADLVTTPGDTVDIAAALNALHERGLRHVLCEGGPILLGDLARSGRLNELCLTLSPRLVAGGAGRITAGPPLEEAALKLRHLLEEDGFLFSRWVRP